jgi:hypothetical protein
MHEWWCTCAWRGWFARHELTGGEGKDGMGTARHGANYAQALISFLVVGVWAWASMLGDGR